MSEVDFSLSPNQGISLIALSNMILEGEIWLSGDHANDARKLLLDVGQECALQVKSDE